MCWWCPILIISVRGGLDIGHSDECVFNMLPWFHSWQSQTISNLWWSHTFTSDSSDRWEHLPTPCLLAAFVSGWCQYHTDQYIAKIRFSAWFVGKNGKTDAPRTNLLSWTGNTRRDWSGQFVSDIYFRLLTGRSTAAGLSMLYLCSIHKDSVTHVKAIHSLW